MSHPSLEPEMYCSTQGWTILIAPLSCSFCISASKLWLTWVTMVTGWDFLHGGCSQLLRKTSFRQSIPASYGSSVPSACWVEAVIWAKVLMIIIAVFDFTVCWVNFYFVSFSLLKRFVVVSLLVLGVPATILSLHEHLAKKIVWGHPVVVPHVDPLCCSTHCLFSSVDFDLSPLPEFPFAWRCPPGNYHQMVFFHSSSSNKLTVVGFILDHATFLLSYVMEWKVLAKRSRTLCTSKIISWGLTSTFLSLRSDQRQVRGWPSPASASTVTSLPPS